VTTEIEIVMIGKSTLWLAALLLGCNPLAVFRIIKIRNPSIKRFNDGTANLFVSFRGSNNDKIVSTDMPDKISSFPSVLTASVTIWLSSGGAHSPWRTHTDR